MFGLRIRKPANCGHWMHVAVSAFVLNEHFDAEGTVIYKHARRSATKALSPNG
jgi:hypothetical protein